MENQYKFQASASWTLHHRGQAKVHGVIPEILDFAVPPEFGGEEGLWTPEHLLLAAVGSCFATTFRGMAEKSKLDFKSIDVAVEGVIEKEQGGLRFTQIFLRPEAIIDQETDRERTVRLLEKAERGCLIARSLSCKIEMKPLILVEMPLPV